MEWTGEMAKQYREARGFGLQRMGRHLGKSHITVQNIENGRVVEKYSELLTNSYDAWVKQRQGNYHNEQQQKVLIDLGMEHMIKRPETDVVDFGTQLKVFKAWNNGGGRYIKLKEEIRFCTHCIADTMQSKEVEDNLTDDIEKLWRCSACQQLVPTIKPKHTYE